MEKRSRSDTADIYADGDDESQADSTDCSKLSVTQHNQSHPSIISMEDEEFASDDEKVKRMIHVGFFCVVFVTKREGCKQVFVTWQNDVHVLLLDLITGVFTALLAM